MTGPLGITRAHAGILVAGVLAVAATGTVALTQVETTAAQTAVGAVVGVAVLSVVATGVAFASRSLAPQVRLEREAAALARGDSASLPTERADSIGRLATTITAPAARRRRRPGRCRSYASRT